MTDLETRLRSLRVDPLDGASPAELRRRAGARRRRRLWIAATAAAVVLILGAGAAVIVVRDDSADQVVTGPDPSSEPSRPAPNQVIGEVTGVHVEVSPRTDLLDGDLVEVRVEGLENLPGAVILQCAGDVREDDAVASCDLGAGAVQQPDTDIASPPPAAERQTMSVARTIHITRGSDDPNIGRPYDCATEEAGCVLAVGPFDLPVRAVTVPLTFSNTPEGAPTAEITPDTGLQDGQEVTLMAEGLRPNGTFLLQLCEVAPGENCDEQRASTVASDADGVLTSTLTAPAAIYGYWGRTDCTAAPCALVARLDAGERLVEVPLRFDEDTIAPVPALDLDPPGPYIDGQEVIVRGNGFPPGVDLTDQLAQCPADKDPALENVCSYPMTEQVAVGADGAFTTTVQLLDSPPLTGMCVTGPVCVFGWVIVNGPLVVSVPLEFETASRSP